MEGERSRDAQRLVQKYVNVSTYFRVQHSPKIASYLSFILVVISL